MHARVCASTRHCLCGAWLLALLALVRVIERPRLLVLSGGIEFQRSERMIACLDTLVEAEERYMQVCTTFSIRCRSQMAAQSSCRRPMAHGGYIWVTCRFMWLPFSCQKGDTLLVDQGLVCFAVGSTPKLKLPVT